MKRLARWSLRILLIAPWVLLLGLIFQWSYVARTQALLERELVLVRATGDPLTLAELSRPRISPRRNAATYLHRAADDINEIVAATEDLSGRDGDVKYPLLPEDQERLRNLFAEHPQLFPNLQRAAACVDYDEEYCFDNAQSTWSGINRATGDHKRPAIVIQIWVSLAVAEEKIDDAVRRSLLLLNLIRHFKHDPFMIGGISTEVARWLALSSLNQALRAGPVSPGLRDDIEATLADHRIHESLVHVLKTDRALILAEVRTIYAREYAKEAPWYVPQSAYGDQLSAACLVHFRKTLERSQATNALALFKQESSCNKSTTEVPLAAHCLVQSMASRHYAIQLRGLAMSRALRVLNAMQRQGLTDKADPPDLKQLELPYEATLDPFIAQPLRIKKVPAGWIIYSIGENQVDDDGAVKAPEGFAIESSEDVGIGPLERIKSGAELERDQDQEDDHAANS